MQVLNEEILNCTDFLWILKKKRKFPSRFKSEALNKPWIQHCSFSRLSKLCKFMFGSSDLTGIPLSNRRKKKYELFQCNIVRLAQYFILQIVVSKLWSQLLDWEC